MTPSCPDEPARRALPAATILLALLAACGGPGAGDGAGDGDDDADAALDATSDAGVAADPLATLVPIHAGPDGPLGASETMDIVPHGSRLFVAVSQWMQPTVTGAQVLVKDSPSAPFRVFARFASVRVNALRSFELPAGTGAARVLLVQGHTSAAMSPTGGSTIAWLVDDETSFSGELRLPGDVTLRSFGQHTEGAEVAFYAGTRPLGILRGTWDAAARTIRWSTTPELALGDGSTDGFRYTGMAECGGALYATNETILYRRNDGALPAGVPRWIAVTDPIGTAAGGNSGLRGLTCVVHDGKPALLLSPEGQGAILRIEDLPAGVVAAPLALVARQEIDVRARVRDELSARSPTPIPVEGPGSVAYVIAAYNELRPLRLGDEDAHVFGVEIGYRGGCAPGRFCQPRQGLAYDVAACFFVRRERAGQPSYDFACLDGPDFRIDRAPPRVPTQATAFVAVRALSGDPFGQGLVYAGGYDCNGVRSDGTAWLATFPLTALVRP